MTNPFGSTTGKYSHATCSDSKESAVGAGISGAVSYGYISSIILCENDFYDECRFICDPTLNEHMQTIFTF